MEVLLFPGRHALPFPQIRTHLSEVQNPSAYPISGSGLFRFVKKSGFQRDDRTFEEAYQIARSKGLLDGIWESYGMAPIQKQ